MPNIPDFNNQGDLPPAIHQATLNEVAERFAVTPRRVVLARRIRRLYDLVRQTNQLARFVVFGSFVTSKSEPNDVDIFLLMEDSFDVREVSGEARLVFDHHAAQNVLGASLFWVRRSAALGGEQAMVEYWQIKRDGSKRGIVEVVP